MTVFEWKLQEASTHKSANTHAGIVFCAVWPWSFDPKISGFPELTVENVLWSLVILVASVFEILCRKKTDRQTPVKTIPPTTAVGMGNELKVGLLVSSVQVPLNLIGVRAVRPLLLTPATYSQIEQSLLRLNQPISLAPQQQQQKQQQSSATVESMYHCYSCHHSEVPIITSPTKGSYFLLECCILMRVMSCEPTDLWTGYCVWEWEGVGGTRP